MLKAQAVIVECEFLANLVRKGVIPGWAQAPVASQVNSIKRRQTRLLQVVVQNTHYFPPSVKVHRRICRQSHTLLV